MKTLRSLAFASVLALLAAVFFSGCSWLGKGKEVADAYSVTTTAKSGSFTGSYSITKLKAGTPTGKAESAVFSGAWDELDPNAPKSRFAVTAGKQTITGVAPGNGYMYSDFGSGFVDRTKLAKNKKPADTKTSNKISSALANAVVNFRDGQPIANSDGTQTPTIVADISRMKLCGPSLRQVIRAFNSSMKSSSADIDLRISRKATRAISRSCNKLLVTPPQLTFGISAGALTDFLADFDVRAGARRRIHFELHFAGLGVPQTGFDVPKSKSKAKPGGWVPLRRKMHNRLARVESGGSPLK